MGQRNVHQVKEILNGLSKCKIIISSTDKNDNTKYELNWNEEDQIEFVRSLRENDFCKGPLEDYDFPTDPPLWFFKKSYMYKTNLSNNQNVLMIMYIKLSYNSRKNKIIVKSLHKDEKL
jgi:hypothetical protein